MANQRLVIELVEEFVERGYTWNIGGISRPPSVDDMQETLDKANSMLKDGETMEMGRLFFSKIAGHLDVYMLMGDYND